MNKKLWRKVAAGFSFFHGNMSNSNLHFPCCRRIFSGSSGTLGEPLEAFSYWRGSCVDPGHIWFVCVIRSRKFPTYASITPGVDWDQLPFPFARVIFHSDRVNAPRIYKRRNPDPGSSFPPCILGSRNRVCGRDCFELARDASSQVNPIWLTSVYRNLRGGL